MGYQDVRPHSKVVYYLTQREYSLGGCFPGGSLDCFGLILEYHRMRYGIELPCEFEGHSAETYPTSYQDNKNDTTLMLHKYIKTIFFASPDGAREYGDILFLFPKRSDFRQPYDCGIYAGGARILLATTRGIILQRENDYHVARVYKIKE